MTIDEKIKYCKESSDYFDDLIDLDWNKVTDKNLDKFVEYFDYLWKK